MRLFTQKGNIPDKKVDFRDTLVVQFTNVFTMLAGRATGGPYSAAGHTDAKLSLLPCFCTALSKDHLSIKQQHFDGALFTAPAKHLLLFK